MFLSFSYPEINKSHQSDISKGGGESRPESSLTEQSSRLDPENSNYDGDGDQSSSDLSDLRHPHRFYTSSLPDLGHISNATTSNSSRRKKKRRKRRSESELANKRNKATSLNTLKVNVIETNNEISNKLPLLRAHCDLAHSIGRRRGICGHTKELSYLDVSLFSLFYFTDTFDEWLLDENQSKGFPTRRSKQVRAIIMKEVVFSLRTSYFCPFQTIEKLYQTICPSTDPCLIGAARFLQYLFESVLNVPESIHYTNGMSEFIHILKGTGNEKQSTVQDLVKFSLKFSKREELKLLSVPYPAFILSLQNFREIPHKIVLPNPQLDLTEFVIQLADDTDETNSELEMSKLSRLASQDSESESTLCRCFKNICSVIFEYLQNLVIQFPGMFTSSDSIDDSWINGDSTSLINQTQNSAYSWPGFRREDSREDIESASLISNVNPVKRKQKQPKPSVLLDLMAVICLTEGSRYTCFVKCGPNPRRGWAQWAYFDPLNHGAPLVRKVDDCGKWLSRLEKKPEKMKSNWKSIPLDITNMLTTSTLYIYHSKPDYESQNTLFSFVNEL